MTCLPRPVMKTNCSIPAARASSTAYWMTGLSTTGSISLGMALVAGRKRGPMPATGKTALRTGFTSVMQILGDAFRKGLFHRTGALLMSSFPGLACPDGHANHAISANFQAEYFDRRLHVLGGCS